MAPLFSIVIACYNHEEFAREAVNSALSQSYPDKEIIVVDDGSRDSTPDILESYGDSIVFARLPENRGVGAARNHGASLATGEYVVFLDGDDVLMPWALDTYSRLITDHHPILILGRCTKCFGRIPASRTEDFPRHLEFVQYPNFLSKDRSWVYNSSAFVVHRAALLSAGGWSPEIFYQDIQDLLNKLGVAGKTVLVLAPATVWYRMHSTNAVRSISSFVKGIQVLQAKARAGAYPGGQEYQIRRKAWFGGLAFYWAGEGLRSGLYREVCTLLAQNGWLVALAILRRSAVWVAGRRTVETLPVD